MNVVDMEVLENLDYENGKALLLELGYAWMNRAVVRTHQCMTL